MICWKTSQGIVYKAVSTTLAQLALLLSATTTLNLCYLYMGTRAHITNSGNAEFWCRLQRVDRLHQRTRLFWPLMLIKDATDKKNFCCLFIALCTMRTTHVRIIKYTHVSASHVYSDGQSRSSPVTTGHVTRTMYVLWRIHSVQSWFFFVSW